MRDKTEIFVDIRSGSVGAAAVRFSDNDPELLYSLREHLPIQSEFTAERLMMLASGGTRKILSELRKHVAGPVERINVTLGSPWFYSKTSSVTNSGDSQFQYNNDLLRRLFAEETENFRYEHFKIGEAEFIEQKILSVYLNGYRTAKPIGKWVKEMRLSFYISAAPKQFIDAMKREVGAIYHREHITFHTFPLLALIASNEVLQGRKAYVLVDIGG